MNLTCFLKIGVVALILTTTFNVANAVTNTVTANTKAVNAWWDPWKPEFTEPDWQKVTGEWYQRQEFTLDLFGVYRSPFTGELFNNQDDWGAGFGVTYFLTRNVGIGGDTYLPIHRGKSADVSRSPFDDVNLHLVYRVPIGRVAPYLLAGMGRNFDKGEYTAHGAAGIECRTGQNFAVFTEGRYTANVWNDGVAEDNLQLRFGFRVGGMFR